MGPALWEEAMSIPCNICGQPADGLMSVKFYGENHKRASECVSDSFACLSCADKDVWEPVVIKATLELTRALGKVAWCGSYASLAAARAQAKARGLTLKWFPRVEVGLVLMEDEKAQRVLTALGPGDKKLHLLQGGRLH